jgi:hypothetical protein
VTGLSRGHPRERPVWMYRLPREPCALKGARTVRRGIVEKVPQGKLTAIYSTWLVVGSNPTGPILALPAILRKEATAQKRAEISRRPPPVYLPEVLQYTQRSPFSDHRSAICTPDLGERYAFATL